MDSNRDDRVENPSTGAVTRPGVAARGLSHLIGKLPLVTGIATLLANRLYVVRGDSMRPSFEAGHQILVGRASYVASVPSRGNVVIISDPQNADKRIMKRVIGLPGEEIRAIGGLFYVNGVQLEEPYLGGLPALVGIDDRRWRLEAGEYFVLGDNRSRSTDSREFGPIRSGLIVGKVWFRYWPLPKTGPVR